MAAKSFLSLPIFKAPMCLISTSEDGKLQVEKEPLDQIGQIDQPLVVVAIAGLYRTGKSYLMNRLAGETSGFALGKTIESKTKGIWMWCKKHPKKEDTVLFLLDTEGLGDVAKGDSGHDNRIFTIAALLSNVLVYNMMTAFNQDAVEKLTFITEMSKNIRFCNDRQDAGDDQLGLILPKFVLCVRDFSLELIIEDKEITSDEYLEECLQLKTGKDMERYNRPRECIRKYFPTRKCFTFDRPGDRKTMRRLETVSNEELSKAFVEETEDFLKFVYSCDAKVLISSKAVNGRMFASLVKSYIEAIRNGAIPDVDDAIMVVANIENERMASEAVEIFKNMLGDVKLPVLHTCDFEKLYRDMQKSALAQFRLESVFNSEKFEKYAIAEMDVLWEKTKQENLQLVRQHCGDILQQIYGQLVGEKMGRDEYKVAGGYPIYKFDMEAVKKKYQASVEGIDEYESKQVMVLFMDKVAENETKVMMEDQKMTEEERKTELDRVQKEHKEAQESQTKLFESKIEEERQRTEDHQRKMEEERKEYMSKQEEKMEAIKSLYDEQRNLSEKQIAMMREENEIQRKEFQKEIRELSEEYDKKENKNKQWFNEMIESENAKAKERISEVTENFNKLFEAEKKTSAALSKVIESNQKAMDALSLDLQNMKEKETEEKKKLAEEVARKDDMIEKFGEQMKRYNEVIEQLSNQIKQAPNQADMNRMKEELNQVKQQRDALNQDADNSGCSLM